ncbi:MAG: hypothetical protein K6U89_15725 [Chloroflexi bacterium]|nr:hypothetical protein [Chloroflexota bacterium]
MSVGPEAAGAQGGEDGGLGAAGVAVHEQVVALEGEAEAGVLVVVGGAVGAAGAALGGAVAGAAGVGAGQGGEEGGGCQGSGGGVY